MGFKIEWYDSYTWQQSKKWDECNLLHDIISAPKRAKNTNSHYSPILHGCMNTRKVKARFNKFLILLESGCGSTIAMGRLVKKTKSWLKFCDSVVHTGLGPGKWKIVLFEESSLMINSR